MTRNNCITKSAKAQEENYPVFFDDPEQMRVLVKSIVQEIIAAEFEE